MSAEPPPDDGRVLDEALARARAAARRRGTAPLPGPTSARRRGRAKRPSGAVPDLTGSGDDERDPQRIGSLLAAVTADRGWEAGLSEGSIAGRWADLVGADVAQHCRPQRLEGGQLDVVAESTTWATQLRLLAPQLVARLAEQLGSGLVTRVSVHGPARPDWRRGPWRVTGRGPRDTYG